MEQNASVAKAGRVQAVNIPTGYRHPEGFWCRTADTHLMPDPFTIRIFVPDGAPEGVRLIDRMNWTGIGLAFPSSLSD